MMKIKINVLKNTPIDGIKPEKDTAILFFKESLLDWFWIYKADNEIHFSVNGESFVSQATENNLIMFETFSHTL